MSEPSNSKPLYGIGTLVSHPGMGRGRIVRYEGRHYVVVFRGGEARRIAFDFSELTAEAPVGDPDLDRVRQAVREVLQDHGWLEAEIEMAPRWLGGTLRMIPGREGVQPKDLPLEQFFGKIVGVRDKLRVLEQKINSHPTLSPEEKLDLQGYITRSYGSLTSFNVMFADPESQFHGTGKSDS